MRCKSRLKSVTRAALVMLLSAFCLSLQFFSLNSSKASAGSFDNETSAPPLRPCPVCAGPGEQVIYAPTIELPEGSGSELVLNSRSPNVIDVTPTFYTAEGTPVTGQTVQLQPSEIRFLATKSLIPAEHRGREKWGGISLSYTGGTREIWAQLSLHDVGGDRSADVLFYVLKETGSDVQDGLWWMPDKGKAIIALGNSSGSPARVNLQYSDGASQDVNIAPFATEYVRRLAVGRGSEHSGQGGYGESVRITTTAGAAGSVRAAGFVTSAGKGFTSSIRFYDAQAAVQPNLFATSLHVKNAATHMLLRNVSASDVTALARFFPASGGPGTPVELSALTLKPQETVEVNLGPLTAAAAGRADLDVVSVKVENTGPSGSLIGALYSTNVKTGTVYDVPLRDSGPMRNLTGAYPWRLDDDYSTDVSITNVGEQPAKFAVNIFFEGGKYVLDPRELMVGETARFDLRKIRDEQIPDTAGRVIPRSVSSGQFNWSVHGGAETARLIGRGEVVSRSRKVSISYSCPTCCPNSFYDGFFNPNIISIGVNRFAAVIPQERYRDCYNRLLGPYGAWPQWQVSDGSIAQVRQTQSGYAEIDGLTVGSTTVYAAFTGPTYFDTGAGYCYSYTGYSNPSGPIDVLPVVGFGSVSFTSPSPPVIRPSESGTLSVVITASQGTPPNTPLQLDARVANPSGTVSINISQASRTITIGPGQTITETFFFTAATNQPPEFTQSVTLTGRVQLTKIEGQTPANLMIDNPNPKDSSNQLTVQKL